MKGGLKTRHLFNLSGLIIVAFWIVMISLLAAKQYVSKTPINTLENQVEVGEGRRDWKEIFLKGKKVGYSINTIKPFEDGYYIQDEIFLKLNLMGFEKGLYTITQSSVDSNFLLKNFYFKMNSGIISYRLSGKVEGNVLTIKTGTGRRKNTKKLELPEIPMISSGMGPLFKKIKITVGDSHRLSFFDPSTLAQRDAVFNVVAREKIKINGLTYDAHRIETEMWGNRLSFWVDMNGDILKEVGFMGLTLVKSSAANASMNIDTGDLDDFYEITSIRVDKKLPNTEQLALLRLKLEGIDDADFDKSYLSHARQRFSDNILVVQMESTPFKVKYNIPYSGDNSGLKKHLLPEYNIESDDKVIIKKALEISGKTKNPVAVSKKLMKWVFQNLDKRPVINIPSAIEVMQTRAGDCNEHATLLVALLRAVGIPARISVGLVYIREKFFYHAWVEVYTGQWITLDPTLNQMPADVSHISLLRGNLDKQVEIMGLIGKLKIEVIDFEYH